MKGLSALLKSMAHRAHPRLHAFRALASAARWEKTPHGRARKLLRDWLSLPQRAAFDAQGHFDVIGSHTGRRYRIYYAPTGNVRELDPDGKPRLGVCFGPSGRLPPGDVALAQKIALETDELAVLTVANCTLMHTVPSLHPGWTGNGSGRIRHH